MRRKEFADYPFNKKKFAEIIKKASGARSQTEFASEAGLSFSYVNRYVNEKTDKCPTVGTIKKIAVASDGVTYEELLEAAGYDPAKYSHDRPRRQRRKDYLYPVCLSIANSEMEWRIESGGYRNGSPFEITVERSDVRKWYLIPVEKADITKEEIQSVLLSREEFTRESKISFVTDDWDIYEKIGRLEFPLLSLYLSVIKVIGDSVEDEAVIKTSQMTDITAVTKSEKIPFSIQ